MGEPIKWREKLNRDGVVTKGCWVTDSGYTLAEFRSPDSKWAITRPGGAAPFAYTGIREDIPKLIRADIEATAAAKRTGKEVDQCA
jgi:hypothetical protein